MAALIAAALVSTVKNESRDKRHLPHGGLHGECCGFGPPFPYICFRSPFPYIGFRPPFPYIGFRSPVPWEMDILDDMNDGVNNK